MSTARLQALRLVGFKSFAERTVIEFGGGISAIVGPNGSGKSNLADALRWALGEQGRSLRTRRAEDLIFAGSSSRRAQGMADVTLVLDNTDRLLPVDFAEVELGRRLFRSGENEYLLNRQRIRLRDLTDLLDEANLADNAFLFIGQGMVDQALALRPEERRPLFEEAAGTRRHERRRRAAEGELAEAEANLERVRDVLDELRPQARRLATQAQQQEARRLAGLELAGGLVAAARDRLGRAGRESERQAALLTAAHADADSAMSQLREAEEVVASLDRALAARSASEREVRARLDAARGRLLELRLAESRSRGDALGLDRDRARLGAERDMLTARMETAAREAAVAVPDHDVASDDALRVAERRLADALRELAEAREAGQAGELLGRRAREAQEARVADLERSQRRSAEAARRAGEQAAAASEAAARATEAEARQANLATAARHAAEREAAAEVESERARLAAAEADARAAESAARAAGLRVEVAGMAARRETLERLLTPPAEGRLPAQLRAAAGHRLAEGIEVDAALRNAVEAALGDVLSGLVVPGASVLGLRAAGGVLVVAERVAIRPSRERDVALAARAAALGGGALASALRRDPRGQVTRLLARCLWLPDLAAAMAFGEALPSGWRVATLAGEVVTDEGLVRLAAGGSVLQLRAEATDIERSLERARALLVGAEAAQATANSETTSCRDMVARARRAAEEARGARRVAEEAERAGARRTETAARERAWAHAQGERLTREATAATADLAARQAEQTSWLAEADTGGSTATPARLSAQIGALGSRVTALRGERDELAAAVDAQQRRRAALDEVRRRAEIRLAMDAARQEELGHDVARLLVAETEVAAATERIAALLTAELAQERRHLADLEDLESSGRDERDRLATAEALVVGTRERLRASEARARLAEVAAMEVRLQLDAGREALLVELAGIGADGLVVLRTAAGEPAAAAEIIREAVLDAPAAPGIERPAEPEDLGPALEAALDKALACWRSAATSAAAAPGSAAPGPGRLTALRRRYHELGSGNPYAAQELVEVQTRLETLDGQRSDLETAIRETRELIGRLERLITEQFRSTFAALEGAFSRRFEQLFGGGEAQLSLTLPEDLSATGVEITARPPGKKRQPLAMLSGGERALTAVSLLLAMLEVRPVPFCVLDEVDAALDEANVGRFSAALRGLAEHIQFIVITHNRGTIEAADALYGVTVGDDAVSHVISLRLDGPGPVAEPRNSGLGRPASRREPVALPIGGAPDDPAGIP